MSACPDGPTPQSTRKKKHAKKFMSDPGYIKTVVGQQMECQDIGIVHLIDWAVLAWNCVEIMS